MSQNGAISHRTSWSAAPGLPHTQVAVALAFLTQRGTVVVERRRSYPAWEVLYEDAMLKYHALQEAPTGE